MSTVSEAGSVSVVIPSRGRPLRVVDAVHSALRQGPRVLEVIVVLDGPSAESRRQLDAVEDTRLRVIELSQSSGAPAARNRGIAAALGRWVALLDDDDVWLPGKVERQLALADGGGEGTVVATRLLAESPNGTFVWPRRLPLPGQPMGDYLFCRRGVFHGETMLATSTFLASRSLFRLVPFDESLPRHQDWDWILRAAQHPAFEMRMVENPLVRFTIEHDSGISASAWEESYRWINSVSELVSRRAYSAFVLVNVGAAASDQRRFGVAPKLLRAAFGRGRPRLRDLLLFAGFWFVPRAVRRRAKALFGGLR